MGVGKTRAIAAQLLDSLGVTAGGVYTPGAPQPTISFPATGDTGATQTLTISNWSSYFKPVVWVRVVDSGGAEETAATAVTDNEDGTVSVPMPSDAGTYTVQCKIQEFGRLASTVVESEIVLTTPAGARYYRLTGFSDHTGAALPAGTSLGVAELQFWTGASGSGTQYPAAMTSNSAPSPHVASASFTYSATYAPWKTFDHVLSGFGWWLLGRSSAQHLADWIQIDLGAATAILSVWVKFSYYTFPSPNGITVVLQSSPDAITWTTVSTTVISYANLGGYYLL